MKKKVLITGSGGQLGLSIRDIHKDYPNLQFVFRNKAKLDITDTSAIDKILGSESFDYLINCAAYTNVEQAEKTPNIAFKINAEGVKNLAFSCKEHNVVLIHISTDYVFDGEKETPYKVDDTPNPINEYGKSKWKGEKYIQAILSNYFIVRTSWLYHKKHGNNFYKTILEKAKKGEPLYVTDEQTGSPTNTSSLAEFIIKSIIIDKIKKHGIYHFTDGATMTWYSFAKEIIRVNVFDKKTTVVKDNNYRSFARRPKYSVLEKEI